MSRKEYYWTCPYCGANNDPGEKCDCQKEKDTDINNYKAVYKGKVEENNVFKSEK
jgi:hypothetical protein